jgi:hypothetical protein
MRQTNDIIIFSKYDGDDIDAARDGLTIHVECRHIADPV